jgi:hypothetical protein
VTGVDVRRAPGLAALAPGLVRWCRRALFGAAVVVAWAGALTAPAHLTLLVAPVVGALTVGALRLAAAALGAGRPSSRTSVLSGLAGLLVVPFLAGVPLFGPPGLALLMALLMTGSSLLARGAVPVSPPAGETVTRAEVDRLGIGLRDLPLTEVLERWRGTARLTDTGPEVRTAVAELRSLLLDELSRRDPAGVERWLRSGDDDPGRHLPSGDVDRTV